MSLYDTLTAEAFLHVLERRWAYPLFLHDTLELFEVEGDHKIYRRVRVLEEGEYVFWAEQRVTIKVRVKRRGVEDEYEDE